MPTSSHDLAGLIQTRLRREEQQLLAALTGRSEEALALMRGGRTGEARRVLNEVKRAFTRANPGKWLRVFHEYENLPKHAYLNYRQRNYRLARKQTAKALDLARRMQPIHAGADFRIVQQKHNLVRLSLGRSESYYVRDCARLLAALTRRTQRLARDDAPEPQLDKTREFAWHILLQALRCNVARLQRGPAHQTRYRSHLDRLIAPFLANDGAEREHPASTRLADLLRHFNTDQATAFARRAEAAVRLQDTFDDDARVLIEQYRAAASRLPPMRHHPRRLCSPVGSDGEAETRARARVGAVIAS